MINTFLISIVFLNILIGLAIGYFVLSHINADEKAVKFVGFVTGWMCLLVSFSMLFVTIFSLPETKIEELKIEEQSVPTGEAAPSCSDEEGCPVDIGENIKE